MKRLPVEINKPGDVISISSHEEGAKLERFPDLNPPRKVQENTKSRPLPSTGTRAVLLHIEIGEVRPDLLTHFVLEQDKYTR